MGINSTDTAYNFGQLGSMFIADNGPSKPPTGMVFIALTFITDTQFDNTGGLVAESFKAVVAGGGTTAGDTEYNYITTEGSAHDQTAGNANVEKGELGDQVTNSHIFPAGVTIYGRWTEIEASTGHIIAYLGR
tara:strand:- start:701 stop:1099 length:399 start_codon:yes stop_codon:yes gene_type:complete